MRIKTHQIILKEDHLACKIVKLKTAIVKIKIKEVNQKTNQGNSNNWVHLYLVEWVKIDNKKLMRYHLISAMQLFCWLIEY